MNNRVGEGRRVPGPGVEIDGRYEITGPLGIGGMGSVFAGRDKELDRPVAIKLLTLTRSKDARAIQRLLLEARAMARVVHPATVQVFDSGTDAEHGAYLIMERLEGEDLARFLHTHGQLPQGLALALMQQLCEAVRAVHEMGLVHRDLKPANVFVLRHAPGTVPRIKLLDFGIAKRGDDDEHLTHPGDVLGTLVYMAPERWQSDDEVDLRTDVYALGVVLYEMLSGAPPFRADTRAALRLAVLNDTAERLPRLRSDLPEWLIESVEGAMNKSPAARYRDVATFARALGLSLAPSTATPEASALEGPFRGTARYRVLRCLAHTPNAEVYAALDVETNAEVALKRLRRPSGEEAFRLKREFRAASGVRHPNLVRLHRLWEEAGDLLLTMELVEGASLLVHIAGAPERLRSCVAQLVRGLGALHARGLAHCDVKPENVLVEPGGRAVLLDCGLASRWGTRAGARGTTCYMAPETFEGRVGAEADLYSVGAVLHQALTGELPVPVPARGPVAGGDDRLPHLASARAAATAANGDLFELCDRLLASDPVDRPRADEVLAVLDPGDDTADAADHPSAMRAPEGPAELVGREDALRALDQAVTASSTGAPTLVLVEGSSGIGKTALIGHFRRQLEAPGHALVLAGRAREGESIPFPALDEAIDDLGSCLLRLPTATVDALLPRRSGRLAQLFPTLARVPAIARSFNALEVLTDPSHVRRQASDALRELLGRLCERQAVVLVIDDLQWIDPDSGALLAHLLGGHDPPALLVVGAIRPGGNETSPVLQKIQAGLRAPARRIELAPLSHDEACALVRARWRGSKPLDARAADRLARQSGGIPFFAELLASGASEASSPGGLEEVLVQRHRRLPPEARQALELLCTSSRPLPPELVVAAVGASREKALDPLFAGSFIQSTRTNQGWVIEPYHDRISESLRRTLSSVDRRTCHLRLAEKLRSDPTADPEMLVEHLAGCDEANLASDVAQTAARLANDQLAFDRAAALFAMALSHGEKDVPTRAALLRQQALALQNAGRRRESADVLLRASDLLGGGEVAGELQREAGTHLLLSGDVTRGLAVLSPALDKAGLHVPADFAETVQATMTLLGALGTRGLAAASPAVPPSAELLEQVDLCLILAQGLAHIDLRVLPFACQALHAALDAGEPQRLQRACALFVINFVEYLPNPLVAPALDLCRQMTHQLRSPYARALLDAATAEHAHFEGDFLAAEAAFERAERTLLESCPSATRELATVRDIAVFIQYAQKGDFKTQLGRTQRWLAQADVAGDLFHASMLRVAHAIVWIAQDQPRRARDELERAQSEWTGAAGVLEVAAGLYHDIIDRYEERDLTEGPANPMRSSLLRSPAAQTPFLRGYLSLQEAWAVLRAIAGRRAGGDRVPGLREAIHGMRALGLPIWSAVADALEANLDYLVGDQDRAARGLDDAEQKFRRLHMLCLAACARQRRGQFVGGEIGARLEEEADGELVALGVAKPERWARAYWSMFDVDDAKLRTQGSDSDSDSDSASDSARDDASDADRDGGVDRSSREPRPSRRRVTGPGS